MKKKDFWAFTHFVSDDYIFRERWERDDPNLKNELMMIAHNFDPFMGHVVRGVTTHFGSQNSWYHYKRYIIWNRQNESNSWLVELHPTAENLDKPFAQAHHRFEVIMPEPIVPKEPEPIEISHKEKKEHYYW